MLRLKTNMVHRWKEWLLGYGFLLPALTLFGVFLFYPLIQSIYLSLHMTDARGRIAKFVGTEHFVSLLTDSRFYDSFIVTAKFTLYTVPTGIVLGTADRRAVACTAEGHEAVPLQLLTADGAVGGYGLGHMAVVVPSQRWHAELHAELAGNRAGRLADRPEQGACVGLAHDRMDAFGF